MYKFTYLGLSTAHLVLDNENSIFIPNGLYNPSRKKEHDVLIMKDKEAYEYEQDYNYIFTLELKDAYFIDEGNVNNPLFSKKLNGKFFVSNLNGTILLVKEESYT